MEKTFDLTIARQVADQVRAIAIRGVGAGPGAEVAITTSRELSFAHLNNAGAARNVDVQALAIDPKNNKTLNKQFGAINLLSQSQLKLEIRDWNTVDASLQTLRSH